MGRKSSLFKRIYSWHRWLGLILASVLLVLMASGSVLVFKDELSGTEPGETNLSSLQTEITFEDMQAIALRRHPNDRPLAFIVNEDDSNLVTLRMGIDGATAFRDSRRLPFDKRVGELTRGEVSSGFWDFVLRLHRDFLLGYYGKLIVGFIGLMFVLSLVSGFYLYGPTMARMNFGWIRFRKTIWRRSDIHKAIGAASFPWLLVMALSGVFLAFSTPMLQIFQATALTELKHRYPAGQGQQSISLALAQKNALAAAGDQEISFITFPGSEYSTPQHYIFVVHGKESWNRYVSELILVNATSGQIDERRSLPWYLKGAMLSEPVHFGNYGGIPLKLIWTLFGLSGVFLAVSGIRLWLSRRRGRSSDSTGPLNAVSSRRKRNPYALPLLFIALVLSGTAGAMLGNGWLTAFGTLLVSVPLFVLLHAITQSFRAKASSAKKG